MAQKLRVGDQVSVPCARLSLEDEPYALYETEVTAVVRRSVVVDVRGATAQIGTSLVHKTVGILILRVGDLETETALLDPLAKSILQYCRLLVRDDAVTLVEIRSLAELSQWWTTNQGAYSHVVLIAHGRSDAIRFAVDRWITAEELTTHIPTQAVRSKVFLSLCCATGYKAFGSVLSDWTGCQAMIGPFHAVHGAIASQFCQTFLAYQLLEGQTTAVAFRNARMAVPGSTSFRLWQKGRLSAGPK